MSETIERLLQVEEKAKQIIAEARQQGAETAERARREAQQLLGESRERAMAEAEAIIGGSRDEAEKETLGALRRAAEQAPCVEDVDQEKLRQAVRRIVRVIAWGESDRESQVEPPPGTADPAT